MQIAIHHRKGSFSEEWITYCQKNNIPYKTVNCYDTDIVEQVRDCDAIMWHHHHLNHEDTLFAKQLLFSLESIGKKVFPDFHTAWHFDDKLGQKYLMESLEIPLVPSYIFYNKKLALEWAEEANYPKIFKLRGGAGSSNVKLVKTLSEAKVLIKKSFGNGFKQFDGKSYFLDRIKKYKSGLIKFNEVVKGFGRMFLSTRYAKMKGAEKGYVYFQDFIPNNLFDIRVIVIDEKAFAIKRMVRKNDFRASGSGNILYEKENFHDDTIRLAFEVAKKLKSQSCALDFVYDENNIPSIVEVSYCFTARVYAPCVGYWDKYLNFYEGPFNPYGWMVDSVIKKYK